LYKWRFIPCDKETIIGPEYVHEDQFYYLSYMVIGTFCKPDYLLTEWIKKKVLEISLNKKLYRLGRQF